MIEITESPLAQDLFWATKILKEDDPTKFAFYAIIKDGNFTVTDKIRIHRITGLNKDVFKDGSYAIIASSPDRVCLAIPETEVKDMIPNFDGLFDIKDPPTNYQFLCSNNKITQALEFAKLIRGFPKPTALSYELLTDLGASDSKYMVSWYTPEKQVIFTLGNKKAAIMPIRME